MTSAVVTEEEAQLRTDVSVLTKGRNALSKAADLRFSRDSERLTLLKQKRDTPFTQKPSVKNEKCCEPAKKGVYPSDTDSALSKDIFTTDSEEEPWFTCRASQPRRHL